MFDGHEIGVVSGDRRSGRKRMNRLCVRVGATGLAAAALVYGSAELIAAADVAKTPLMVSFADLKWTALPEAPGMQSAALSGDPAVGPYTRMRRVPAGTDNPLHAHSSEITNVIISGVLYTGIDKASAKDFGPGSVVTLPADWVHVSGCRAGSECVFYQDGKGRFDYKPSAPPAK